MATILRWAGAPATPDSVGAVATRGLRSADDFEAMATVLAACRVADGYDTVRSASQLRDAMDTFVDFDPSDGVRLAEADGQVVGFAYGVMNGDQPDIGRVLFHNGGVLPGWRGIGIGRMLLSEAQAAARRHASRRAGPVPASTVYRAYVGETDTDARRLLEHDGYAVARWCFAMVRPTLDGLPSPVLPPGIDGRPATAATAMQTLRAMTEAMADDWGVAQWTDEELEASLRHPLWGQLDVWQVAWDGNEVAGGVLGFINDEENRELGRARGYTECIFTRRPWRGGGIATALIGRNLRLLAERGMNEAALAVDTQNPSGALALYERVGFVRDRMDLIYQRPV